MPIRPPKVLSFNVLIEKSDGAYVAHCLETSLVASALTEIDSVVKMAKLLDRQIRFALENDRLGDIYHFAPKEVVAKFQSMERFVSQVETPISCGSKGDLMIRETAYALAC